MLTVHGELYVMIISTLLKLQWHVVNWGFQVIVDIAVLILQLGKQLKNIP